MIAVGILEQLEAELSNADSARAAHLEGRARVSARRAAGLAIRGYYEAHRITSKATSAMEFIYDFRGRIENNPEVLMILDHLIERVNPDFALPEEIDLIGETRRLVQFLREE